VSTSIRVVQRHHVHHHVHRAIGQRLGRPALGAVLAVDRAPERPNSVVLHVDSGGNALACRTALIRSGYRCEDATEQIAAEDAYELVYSGLLTLIRYLLVRNNPWEPAAAYLLALAGPGAVLLETLRRHEPEAEISTPESEEGPVDVVARGRAVLLRPSRHRHRRIGDIVTLSADPRLAAAKEYLGIPVVVAICGSTRFMAEMAEADVRETAAGRIVVKPGCDMKQPASAVGRPGRSGGPEVAARRPAPGEDPARRRGPRCECAPEFPIAPLPAGGAPGPAECADWTRDAEDLRADAAFDLSGYYNRLMERTNGLLVARSTKEAS
jgi:hypothetical protein